MRTLTRPELTAALAVRQGLAERLRVAPAEAVRRLTPLQAQHPPAPYLALAARVEGFTREGLEAAITDGAVVKTTINRLTLHLAAAADYPAYAQLTRQARMRTWRKQFAHLDEEKVTAELREWFREPRSNADVREHVGAYEGVAAEPWAPVIFARTLVPLIQLPPAGHWDDSRRAAFVADPRPLPDPADAATLVLERYLAAFGPASRRDAAAWAGVAQRDFAAAWERLETVEYGDACAICRARRSRPPTRRCPRASSGTGTRRCSPTPTASASSRRSCTRWRRRSAASRRSRSTAASPAPGTSARASWRSRRWSSSRARSRPR